MGDCKNALKILIGKPTEKRSLGRPRREWEDNIWMDLKEIDINMRNWVDSAEDRDYTAQQSKYCRLKNSLFLSIFI